MFSVVGSTPSILTFLNFLFYRQLYTTLQGNLLILALSLLIAQPLRLNLELYQRCHLLLRHPLMFSRM